MAREVKETPVLKGAAADRFEKAEQDNQRRKVPKDAFMRAKTAYEQIMKSSKLG